QNNQLRAHEGRLFLRRSHSFQGRYFEEGLYHSNEYVEVKGNRGANHVNRTPSAREVKGIARQDRNCQHHERYKTDLVGWQKVIKRKEEAGYARHYGARQKKRSPAVETFPGEQPEYHDES